MERKEELEKYLGYSTTEPSSEELKKHNGRFRGDSNKQLEDFYQQNALIRIRRDMLHWNKIPTAINLLKQVKEAGLVSGTIIDYGCGVADYGLVFAEAGYKVILVDFANLLKFAEWRFKKRGLQCSTIKVTKDNFYPDLPKVDLVIFGDILEDLPKPLFVLQKVYLSLNTKGLIWTSAYPIVPFVVDHDHLCRERDACVLFLNGNFEEIKGLYRKKLNEVKRIMIELLVVASVTQPEVFEKRLAKALELIGCDYKLILTDPKLPYAKSLNTIVRTNKEDLEQSKYLFIISQDEKITENGWGRKLVNLLDTLPDLGYAGVECLHCDEIGQWWGLNMYDYAACEAMDCDASIIIIPCKIFLEHQFDEHFEHIYGFPEDYACWVRLERKLKVYHVPIPGLWTGHRDDIPPKLIIHKIPRKDHEYLLRKWNLKELRTTGYFLLQE